MGMVSKIKKMFKINKNFFFLLFISVSFLLNYINYVIISKFTLPIEFSIFYTSMIIASILLTPTIIFNFYNIKRLRKNYDNRDFYNKNLSEVFSEFVLFLIVYFLFLQIFYYLIQFFFSLNYKLYLVIIFSLIFQSIIEFLRTNLEVQNQIKKSAIYTLLFNFLKFFLCTFIVLFFSTKVWIIFLGIILSQIIICTSIVLETKFKINFFRYNFKKINLNKNYIIFSLFFFFLVNFIYLDNVSAYFFIDDNVFFASYMASNVLPKSLILYFLPFFKMYYPKLHDKETSIIKNLKVLFLLLLLTLSSLFVINFINLYLPNFFKIKNVDNDLLINCSLIMILITISMFMFINNLAKRNYKILSVFLIIVFTTYYYLIIRDSINYSFDIKFLIFYLISFLILTLLNMTNLILKK